MVLFFLCAGNRPTPGSSAKSKSLTIPDLQKRLKSAQDNSELPANVKEKVVQYLQDALERLEISQENLEKAEKFERQLPNAAEGLRAAENRLNSLPSTAEPEIANVKELEELTRLVESRERNLTIPKRAFASKSPIWMPKPPSGSRPGPDQ